MVEKTTLITAGLALALIGCDVGRQVTVYPVAIVDPETNSGHNRIPLNPTTYRIGYDEVVAETAGNLTKYEDCAVLNANSWSCSHSDGSGSFGMRDGSFWESPGPIHIEHVSSLQYNWLWCQLSVNDPYEGRFWGAVRCLRQWW